MRHARSTRRLALILAHLGKGASLALYIGLLSRLGRRPTRIPDMARRWHRRLCGILGIRIRVVGRPHPGCLLIGNHISWLDIPVVGAQGEIAFLSKAEVRDWPLIGWLADTAGTLFVERGAIRIEEIAWQLRKIGRDRTLMLFPEGTTSDGSGVLRFHPRLFALAQETGLEIQPVAIAYRCDTSGAHDSVAPFIGDDTLLAHLLRVVRHPGLTAEVHFLPPVAIDEENTTRRLLAERTRRAIVEALGIGPDAAPHRPRPAGPTRLPDPVPDPIHGRRESITTDGIAHVA
ncbi:lysophospholipid acyltransferase family protein [Thiocapsa bogorovii]|uniref:lysophospholipid acyltransferase family protein n=1 Tax=Thiocapsa bogorovii TaxID=521689 RepID=UPI001E47A9A6|nr:lysophospholipid acyltransferase family protein [Thiocapsa bogorovii]UHD18212.1 1-acyl-sn-glycerol-3-phosphate acyltransferase [Thiocapsa bogorovii]